MSLTTENVLTLLAIIVVAVVSLVVWSQRVIKQSIIRTRPATPEIIAGKHNSTALLDAVYCYDFAAVRYLLSEGNASPNSHEWVWDTAKRRHKRVTALELARQRARYPGRFPAMIKMLIAAGLKPERDDVLRLIFKKLPDPFHYHYQLAINEAVEALLTIEQTREYLIASGDKVLNHILRTENHDYEILHLLMSHGVKPQNQSALAWVQYAYHNSHLGNETYLKLRGQAIALDTLAVAA